MSFLEINSHESSNLNTSLGTSTPLPQTPANNTSQETPNLPRQHRPLPPIPNYDPQNGPKSNYSSINNILPCTDENNGFRSKRDGECYKDGTPFSSVTFQDNSLKSLEISSSRQKTSLETSLNGAEKLPSRNSTRPPLNPNDVSRGLSALHLKVDELLKKTSQVRASSVEGEKPRRAASTDSRGQNSPAQVFTLNALQSETIESSATKSGLYIDLSANKNHDASQFSSAMTDGRDNTPQLRSLKAPASPYQDLLLKDKANFGTPKVLNSPRSESKDMVNRSSFRMEVAKNFTDTKYIRRQEQTPSHINHHNTSKDDVKTDEQKPKYDENKLEAIVARIKERNSVSPAPRQRSSVTLQEASTPLGAGATVAKTFWSTSKKNDDIFNDRREARTEERAPVVPINWQFSHIAQDIEEIPNEKDVNITGNTTILELFDKRGSINSPKFGDDLHEDENGHRHPARSNKMAAGERKFKIVVPKATATLTGNSNEVAKTTIYLQDILKDLQIEKPLVIKERAGSVKRTEPVHEKTRNMAANVQNFELREKSLNSASNNAAEGYRSKVRDEEGIKKRAEAFNQSSEVKSSSKYFVSGEGELTAMDAVLKQELWNAGSSVGIRQQGNNRQKSVDASRGMNQEKRAAKDIFQFKKQEPVVPRLQIERGRALDLDKTTQDFQQVNPHRAAKNPMQSPPKRAEDDSLLLDDSVFSVKEGGVNTHRQININNAHQQDAAKKNIQHRNVLDTTVVRTNFLQEDNDISDFDFDRNRYDTQDLERSKGSTESFLKFEDNYLENLGVKRQKFSEGKTQTFGLNELVLPKTELPRKGTLSRAK